MGHVDVGDKNKCIPKFWSQKPNKRDTLGDLGIDIGIDVGRKDKTKMCFKETGCGLDQYGPEEDPMAGSCAHRYEHSGYIKQ